MSKRTFGLNRVYFRGCYPRLARIVEAAYDLDRNDRRHATCLINWLLERNVRDERSFFRFDLSQTARSGAKDLTEFYYKVRHELGQEIDPPNERKPVPKELIRLFANELPCLPGDESDFTGPEMESFRQAAHGLTERILTAILA